MRARFALAGLLLALLAACASPAPLGDGSLSGVLPEGWTDSTRPEADMVLRVTDDEVPLPGEIVVRRASPDIAPVAVWAELGEKTVPAPRARVGDRPQDNNRQVRVYVRLFSDGRVLEAEVDVRLDRGAAEGFLNSLRPAG